jgi:hypothetical protein
MENDLFLTVEEAAKILRSSASTIYVYLCKRGTKGGAKGKRIPEGIYTKFGSKTLFIKDKFMEWAKSGAVLV